MIKLDLLFVDLNRDSSGDNVKILYNQQISNILENTHTDKQKRHKKYVTNNYIDNQNNFFFYIYKTNNKSV